MIYAQTHTMKTYAMRIFLINMLCLACLDAFAADIFGNDTANPSLFGIRLGQTIPLDDAEFISRYKICTNGVYRQSLDIIIPSQLKCCGFTPEPEYQDPQFSRHRIIIDDASRRVVAVDAQFYPLLAPFHIDAPVPEPAQLTNLLQQAFSRYGQYETRLSDDKWQSGDIYRITFFTASDAGIVISHHSQFGGNLCLYRASGVLIRNGRILPERYPKPSFLEKGWFCEFMGPHPALHLYEQYRNRRQSTIGILEKRFAMSASKLKSDKIPQPEWKHIFLKNETGKYGSIVMNGKDSTWEMQAYMNNKVEVWCHLRLFDSAAEAYDCGMDMLTNRLLPGDTLCGMFRLVEDISDICLVTPKLEASWGAQPTVVLMRANGVFVCEFSGQSENHAADAAWLLDFFQKKSGTRQVDDSMGECIEIRRLEK